MTEQVCEFCRMPLDGMSCCPAAQMQAERDAWQEQAATLQQQVLNLVSVNRESNARLQQARGDLAGARHEVAMLQECGAILLRAIYESGIAYDNPEVELALAAFARSPE